MTDAAVDGSGRIVVYGTLSDGQVGSPARLRSAAAGCSVTVRDGVTKVATLPKGRVARLSGLILTRPVATMSEVHALARMHVVRVTPQGNDFA